jgi:cell division protein FtsA
MHPGSSSRGLITVLIPIRENLLFCHSIIFIARILHFFPTYHIIDNRLGIESGEVVMIPGIAGRKATTVSVKNLAIIIEERLKELAAIVVVEVSKHAHLKHLKAGIVLTGGGAQLPYIDELFQKFTGLDARIGDPNATSSNSEIAAEIKDPSFATVIGLVQVYYDQQETADAEEEQMASMPLKDMETESDYTAPNPPKQAPRIGDLFRKMVDVVMGDDEGADASY